MVSIAYSILDEENGEVLEKSDLPVAYVHQGHNNMFPEVEAVLDGKKSGDQVEVILIPEQAFGFRDPNEIFTDAVENVPEEFRHIGAQVEMQNDSGEQRTFVVSKIEDGQLTLDGNHPFAGKTIKYAVTIADIRDATEEEIEQGVSKAPVVH